MQDYHPMLMTIILYKPGLWSARSEHEDPWAWDSSHLDIYGKHVTLDTTRRYDDCPGIVGIANPGLDSYPNGYGPCPL